MSSRTHSLFRWAGVTIALILFLALIFKTNHTHAENERVITIYHDSIQQTVVTDATTVAEVLKRVNVSLAKNDNIEPAADTQLTAPSYSINIYRARPVAIVDGLNRYELLTAATSAGEIVKSAGLALYPEDTTTLTRIDNFIGDGGVGLKLTIDRATPINFVLYGKQFAARTQSQTVGDLLKEKGVVLGESDGVNIANNTPIVAGLTVQVWRDGAQIITEEQPIAFTTRQIFDVNQPAGYKKIQTEGVAGKRSVTFEITMRNGVEISRKEIQAVTIDQPQQQIEVVGSRPSANIHMDRAEIMLAVGIQQSDWVYVDYIINRESGWCATKAQGEWGKCLPFHGVPTSGGYGLCQSTPPSKMASAGEDWQTNPVTQLKWCNSYALKRYGSWEAAYNHWLVNHNW